MSASDAAPLPRLGEVFFDVRGNSRSMRLSWYADTGVAVFSIWQGGMCTGTFRLPIDDLARMIEILQRGPHGRGVDAGDRGGRGHAEQAYDDYATGYSGDQDGAPEYGATDYGATDYGATDYGATDYGATEYEAGEHGRGAHRTDRRRKPDYGSDEYGAGEYGRDEHGPREHGPREHGPSEQGATGQHRARDHGARDHGARDHRARDHGAGDHGAGDYGADDYGADDYGAGEYAPQEHGRPDYGAGYAGGAPGYVEDPYPEPGRRAQGYGADSYGTEAYRAGDYGPPDYEQMPGAPRPARWRDDERYQPDVTGQHSVTGDQTGYDQQRFVPPYVRPQRGSSEAGYLDDSEYRLPADPRGSTRHSADRPSGGQR